MEMLSRGTYTKLFFIPGYKQIKHLTFIITQGLVFLFITQGRCSIFCNTGGKVFFFIFRYFNNTAENGRAQLHDVFI